jgi:hypothetical protein
MVTLLAQTFVDAEAQRTALRVDVPGAPAAGRQVCTQAPTTYLGTKLNVELDAITGAIDDAFRADLLVEERVIVEVKSLEHVVSVHKRQLLTYLRLTNLRVGLLLNFGAEVMKDGIDRVVHNYRA